MSLTGNQLVRIEQLAANLKKWADNLSYRPPSPTIIMILPFQEHKKIIMWLLSEMPAVGQRVEQDFDELYKMHNKVNSWRDKAITEDESVEFQILIDQLKGIAYDLVDTLLEIVQKNRAELKNKERSKLWAITHTIKLIFYFISGLAALLTCIYLLWWLWTKFVAK